MTITQTVEIPPNRWLNIEVPEEVPIGPARVEVKILPFAKDSEKPEATPKFRISKSELDELMTNAHTPHTDALTGILAHLGDITAEQIREERQLCTKQ